jgi:hypothetical protein
MNGTKWLKLVNPLLFLTLITQVLTGVIFIFRINTGYNRFVGELHQYNGIFLAVIALAHLILNWSWVKANFFKRTISS